MNSLDKNIEELRVRGTLTMQLLLLVTMGMFLSLHVALSFAWGGLMSILSGEQWIPTSLLYLQSWEFSRFSVGVPFAVLFITAIIKYLYWSSRDIREEAYIRMVHSAQGQDFTWTELGPGDFPYRCMTEIARKANIDTPRMFWCSLNEVNAFTFSIRNGQSAIVLFDPILRNPIRFLVDAVIAHEIGHIVSSDHKRDKLMNIIIGTFCVIFVLGYKFYHERTRECLIMRKADEPMYIAVTNAGLFLVLGIILMFVGFIPWSWSKGLLWWRDYVAEYMADGRGAKLLDDPMRMPDMLILLHCVMQGTKNIHDLMDEHPPDVGRVQRFIPDFDGDWKTAARNVVRRHRISN